MTVATISIAVAFIWLSPVVAAYYRVHSRRHWVAVSTGATILIPLAVLVGYVLLLWPEKETAS